MTASNVTAQDLQLKMTGNRLRKQKGALFNHCVFKQWNSSPYSKPKAYTDSKTKSPKENPSKIIKYKILCLVLKSLSHKLLEAARLYEGSVKNACILATVRMTTLS